MGLIDLSSSSHCFVCFVVHKGVCQEGALFYNGQCYKYVHDAMPWEKARTHCKTDESLRNGDLASIKDIDTSKYLRGTDISPLFINCSLEIY